MLRRERRRLLESVEAKPTDALVDGVIRHFLYAPRGSREEERAGSPPRCRRDPAAILLGIRLGGLL